MSETCKLRRRWYQYSLRSLMLVVLFASLGMSWYAVRMQRARQQKEAIEEIRKFGGYAVYDYRVEQFGTPLPHASPPEPAWLRDLLGEDFFSTAVYVSFSPSSNDAGLAHLNGFTKLQTLDLTLTQVTDAGLEHLKGLTRLETLNLYGARATDAGLEHLKGMTQLRCLELGGTKVGDAGLEYLKGMTKLEHLGLMETQVTDAGLDHLKGMTQLRDLRLTVPNVTPEGVDRLRRALPKCQIGVGYHYVPPAHSSDH